jgi:exopolyphosphatase/guanosine-5'-triphosphate,3'-diphosphate pyrophosphatase
VRSACIDIGATTTRLLVAELREDGRLRTVASARAYTPASAALLASVVDDQLLLAHEAGAEDVVVVGTAHLRGEPELSAALSVPVRILTGEEEGALAFTGAVHAAGATGSVAVVDVGGGSTEVVCGSAAGGPAWLRSFAVGSSLLVQRCVPLDPPTAACVERLRAAASDALKSCEPPPAARALAVGGSATALAAVIGTPSAAAGDEPGRGDTADRPPPLLTPALIDRSLRALGTATAEQFARRTGLHPRRARLLPAGLVLLREAATRLGRPLQVAQGGLREGVVLRELVHRGVV